MIAEQHFLLLLGLGRRCLGLGPGLLGSLSLGLFGHNRRRSGLGSGSGGDSLGGGHRGSGGLLRLGSCSCCCLSGGRGSSCSRCGGFGGCSLGGSGGLGCGSRLGGGLGSCGHRCGSGGGDGSYGCGTLNGHSLRLIARLYEAAVLGSYHSLDLDPEVDIALNAVQHVKGCQRQGGGVGDVGVHQVRADYAHDALGVGVVGDYRKAPAEAVLAVRLGGCGNMDVHLIHIIVQVEGHARSAGVVGDEVHPDVDPVAGGGIGCAWCELYFVRGRGRGAEHRKH